ncbi:MAG: flagellar motor protein [Syntrophaceticus sp.]|nr:flagellar motor protein [Syntrophaceticus sp.]
MDIATIIGLLIGFAAVIAGFLLEGGQTSALFSLTALIIVLGGTIGATAVSFNLKDIKKFPVLLAIAFKNQIYDKERLIDRIVDIAVRARRDSLLRLEDSLETIDDDFLRKGLQMIIDRIDTPVLRDVLENDIYYMDERHRAGISIFDTAGGYSPTMGIIGTVVGLINVLGHMESPDTIAPAIAVAFIATLYGIVFANLFWLPIASKLKAKNNDEVLYRSLILEGLLAIQKRENPNFIKEKLQSFLEQKDRSTERVVTKVGVKDQDEVA